MHNEDADIDEPLSAEQLQVISEAETSFEPNAEVSHPFTSAHFEPLADVIILKTARQLREMGFDTEEVNQALRVTKNNQESALA